MSTPAKTTWKKPALRLMAVAERLIGEHGYDNVSLVQIAKSAGQANKYAVQYHFGDKENLVRAIFDDRLARIGARRRALLDGLDTGREITARDLLHAFIHPVYQEVDDQGRHSYARFAERMLETPLAQDLWFASAHFATSAEVRQRLAELSPHLSAKNFAIRYSLISAMLIQTLAILDRNPRAAGNDPATQRPEGSDAEILEAAIAIADRAFAAAP